jgi:predicted NAD-dependent protein-ADP-ribosyltransferase YbiA (DUF1768 family)
MNTPIRNAIDYPGIDETDAISRVIEKPDGTRVSIFQSGSVVVHPAGAAARTHLPDGRSLAMREGQVVETTPKRTLPAHRRPLNVASSAHEEIGKQLSNFAARRFTLDGRSYASVEGWYQGLKWPERAKRAEIARLSGGAAKRAGGGAPKEASFVYEGRSYAFGSAEHHALIKAAIKASLAQNPEVKAAFIETHPRPIVHVLGRPEKAGTSLPGTKFARILEEIREEFVAEGEGGGG